MPKKKNEPEAIIPLSGMEKIYAGIGREHKPGDPGDMTSGKGSTTT